MYCTPSVNGRRLTTDRICRFASRFLRSGFLITLFLALQVTQLPLWSQYVPNPSFELQDPNCSVCPAWPSSLTQPWDNQIDRLLGWDLPTGGTSDWYHVNAEPPAPGSPIIMGVPSNWAGMQLAHGQGYVGIIIGRINSGSAEYREYVQARLLQPLLLGQKYAVSFQVVRAEHPDFNYSIKNIGACFSATSMWNTSSLPLACQPQVHSDVLLTSTGGPNDDQWITISDNFTVQHEDKHYITIGNFQPQMIYDQVDPQVFPGEPFKAYYFVDNVEVELLPSDCICNFDVQVERASEDEAGKCCYKVTISSLENACPLSNVNLRVGTEWQDYNLDPALAPGESTTLDFCVDEFHSGSKTLKVELQDRNRVPLCPQPIERAIECPCTCYDVEFERNYAKADECCYIVTVRAFDKSCDLDKLRITSGRFPGHEFVKEFNPPLQANGTQSFEYCAPSTDFTNYAEFDIEFLDAGDNQICDPALVAMLCRCKCSQSQDGSLSARLEPIAGGGDMCCWDVVLANDLDCDRVIYGVSVGGSPDIIGFESTSNPDWTEDPVFTTLVGVRFGWSKVDPGFNGAYIGPNSSEVVGRICLPAGSDPATIELFVHYIAQDPSGSCFGIEADIDCPEVPANCCDVLHADISIESGGEPPAQWVNPCGRFLHLHQDPSQGCDVHGIRVTDVGSGALLFEVPYDPTPAGIVDLSDPAKVWLRYDLPCGGATRTIRIEFLDANGLPFCSEEESASCFCPGDISPKPGGLGSMQDLAPGQPTILAIRPNPARDDAEIVMNLPVAGEATIEVFNLAGHLLAQYTIGARPAGSNIVRISVSALTPGTYQMQLRIGDAINSQQFTVVR